MVATILSLRWRILIHQFRRDWWRLLFVAAGGIWSLSVVPALLIASRSLSRESFAVKQDSLVAAAFIIAIAWVVVPLLATGVDDSLDPARFAPLGVSVRRLMPGLAIAAFTTIPAIFFIAVAAVMASVWRGHDREAEVLAVAGVGALLSVLSWIFTSRLAVLWAARLLVTRAAKAVVSLLALAAAGVVAAAVVVVRADGFESVLETEIATVLAQAGRTPIGAGFAAPTSIVVYNEVGAVWRLAMMAAWVLILFLAWRAAVAHVLVNPVTRGGGTWRGTDAVLAAGLRTGRAWRRLSPTTTAVVARTARSWRSDPRYVTQVVGAIVLPLSLGGLGMVVAGSAGAWVAGVPVVLGITIGWGRHNDLAYDSSAVWLDIVSGVRGGDVVRGRLFGVALWAVPVVLAASVMVALMSSRWHELPAVAATSVGALGAALGVAAVTSVVMPYGVPAPGESPFGADAGSIGASLVGQVVSSVGTGAVLPFIVGPLVGAVVWGGIWWGVAAVLPAVVGAACAWWGAGLAGRLYDAKSGKLVGSIA